MAAARRSRSSSPPSKPPRAARRPDRRRRLFFAAGLLLPLLLLAHPARLAAQAVSGVVRAEDAAAPLEGALISLLDEAGRARAATLTDRAGRFRIAAPAAGSWRLRAERVGYQGTVSERFQLAAGQTITRDLVAPAAPVAIGGIEVSAGERRCTVRPRDGLQAATLWDEARKALESAAVTEAQRLVRFGIRRYERDLDAQTLRVQEERASQGIAYGERPFASRPAAELAEQGYVRMDGEDRVFYAPDATVLLSDEFLDTHCFRVEEERSGEGLVGLAFEPTRDRRIPDVEGVLWLSPRTAELRRIEFDYTGTQLPDAAASGGRVEYERLPTGAWIVRRWYIRMPQLARDAGTGRVSVNGIREAGGEVTGLETGGGPRVAAARGGAIQGLVWDSIAGGPLAGARVYLSGTSYAAVSDSAGRFRVERVPEGSYSLGFLHPRLEALDIVVPPTTVALGRGLDAEASLAIPSLTVALALGCGAVPGSAAAGVLVGQVVDPVTGAAVPEARVTVRPARGREVAVTADAEGRYRLCLGPTGPVEVRAQIPRSRGEAASVQLAAGAPTRLDLAVAPPAVVALEGVDVTARGTLAPDLTRSTARHVFAGPELRQMNDRGVRMTDMLQTRFPVQVRQFYPPTEGICVEYGRGPGMTTTRNVQPSTGDGCNMIEVYLDGVRLHDPGVFLRTMALDAVESVELLTAIEAGVRYGSRGAGVLLITTRKG